MAANGHALPLPPDEVIFGQTSTMRALREKLRKVNSAHIPVLIEGESGTGKEVIANYIHQRSGVASGPFVKVNCPAIPGTLIESELFGFEKGAFTGAYGSKPGRVESADSGTLFMDEIGELGLDVQAKLLHFLQDGQFARIGGQEEKRVDVRLICATNRSLEDEIAEGKFRGDLYYRINVVNLELSPLRERVVDIPVLAEYFLKFYAATFGLAAPNLSSWVMESLLAHHWPGNIRELENLIKRFVIVGSEEELINGHHWVRKETSLRGDSSEGATSLKDITRQAVLNIERKAIFDALHTNHWNRKLAARQLNISYRALLYKIKSAGLPAKRVLKGNAKAAAAGANLDGTLPAASGTETD